MWPHGCHGTSIPGAVLHEVLPTWHLCQEVLFSSASVFGLHFWRLLRCWYREGIWSICDIFFQMQSPSHCFSPHLTYLRQKNKVFEEIFEAWWALHLKNEEMHSLCQSLRIHQSIYHSIQLAIFLLWNLKIHIPYANGRSLIIMVEM